MIISLSQHNKDVQSEVTTLEFEIKKDVPLPKRRGKPIKYDIPLDEMRVGDHIKIDMQKIKITKEAKLIRNYILSYKYRNPTRNYTVRAMQDGVGIWRIE